MDWFDYAFTLGMILFPAVFTLFVRQRDPAPEKRARNARFTRVLWAATAGAVIVFLSLARWYPAVAYFMWFMFFPLWFLLAMPLLQSRDPGWGPIERGAMRSASLVSRDRLPRRLRLGWLAISVLWGLLLCAAVTGLALAVSQPVQWWLLFFNLAAGFELWILHWAMRRSMVEPEPVLPGESMALGAERESFRRFKLYGWFVLAAMVMLIFSLPPLLLIWFGDESLTWAIAIGAGGGALGGIGGGVFGTIASIKRARINRLYLESAPPE